MVVLGVLLEELQMSTPTLGILFFKRFIKQVPLEGQRVREDSGTLLCGLRV